LNYIGSGPIIIDAPSNMDVYLDQIPTIYIKCIMDVGDAILAL